MIITPIAIYPMFATGQLSGIDMVMYLAWDTVYGRAMTQTLAEAIGLTLDEVPFPEGVQTPRTWLHQALFSGLQDVVLPAQTDPMNTYRVGALAQLAGHLSLADQHGAAVDAAKLDDAAEVLGQRPRTPLDADAQIQALALASGPERDADLIRYFHRDYVRQERLLGPLLGPLAETATLSPIV
jgi:hypothetical protein